MSSIPLLPLPPLPASRTHIKTLFKHFIFYKQHSFKSYPLNFFHWRKYKSHTCLDLSALRKNSSVVFTNLNYRHVNVRMYVYTCIGYFLRIVLLANSHSICMCNTCEIYLFVTTCFDCS